jgi:protein TonB
MRAREARIGVLVVAISALGVSPSTLFAQVGPAAARPGMPTAAPAARQPPPLPAGREILAADGDRIIIPNEARVAVVSRYEGQVRVVTDAERMVLVVLVDYRGDNGGPDGIVDRSFRFSLLSPFPHAEKWDGWATVDEATRPGPVRTPFSVRGAGRSFDLVGGPARPGAATESGVDVFSYSGMGGGGQMAGFDAAEAAAFANASGNWSANVTYGGTPAAGESSTTLGLTAGAPGGVMRATPAGPLRAGGNIRPPTKIVDVPPVYPAQAFDARIAGVVILELTIDTDGSVANARVLRSIPLLDQAALDAARQWKYTPTLLNGEPKQVILTATVNFTP